MKSIFGGVKHAKGLEALAQYPDKRVFEAAGLLRPEDRPQVPVRVIDKDPVKFPVFRVAPNVEGIADFKNNQVLITRDTPGYRVREQLAGIIGHEAEHLKTGEDEYLPTKKQLEILRGMGYGESKYMQYLDAKVRRRHAELKKAKEKR